MDTSDLLNPVFSPRTANRAPHTSHYVLSNNRILVMSPYYDKTSFNNLLNEVMASSLELKSI